MTRGNVAFAYSFAKTKFFLFKIFVPNDRHYSNIWKRLLQINFRLTGVSSILFEKFKVAIKRDIFVDERFEVFSVLPDEVDHLATKLHVVAADGLAVAIQLVGQRAKQTISEEKINLRI